jgi:hypothetical protein
MRAGLIYFLRKIVGTQGGGKPSHFSFSRRSTSPPSGGRVGVRPSSAVGDG